MRLATRIARQLCLTLCLAWGVCLPGQAETGDADQDMYLDALQSISENRYDEAKATLMKLIEREPQHAGAWLDLAIIQCELENKAEADRIFRMMIERFSPPQPILEVIVRQQAKGCLGHSRKNHVSVLLERGFESNANQGASNPNFSLGSGSAQIDLQLLPEYLPKSDSFTALSMNGARALASNGTSGFVQFRWRRYDALSAFNTVAVAAGIDRPWRIYGWGVRTTGMLSLLTLGDHLYQKQGILQLRLTPALALPKNMRFSMIGGLTKVQYPTLFNYDANTWELRGLLSYDSDVFHAQGSVAYLSDRPNGARLGGHRHGLSGNASIRRQLFREYEAELGWSRQIWRSESAYSPGLIDLTRRQDTQVLKAALIWPVRELQTMQLEFRAINNRENISILQYDSKSIQLSWQWQNF